MIVSSSIEVNRRQTRAKSQPFRRPTACVAMPVFGAYAWLNRGEEDGGDLDTTIRVTEREIAWLTETWSRQWRRPPSDIEMQGLLVDYLREELLAREARGLELDRDDIIVRRRLAQKMNFVLEDTARLASPTEEELRARYDADPARFSAPSRISFVTVYFSTDKRGDRAAADARAALGRLLAGGTMTDPQALGDGSLLPAPVEAVIALSPCLSSSWRPKSCVRASEPKG